MPGLGRAGRLIPPATVFASDTLEKFPRIIPPNGRGGQINQRTLVVLICVPDPNCRITERKLAEISIRRGGPLVRDRIEIASGRNRMRTAGTCN